MDATLCTSLEPPETSPDLQPSSRSLSDLVPVPATIFRHSGWAPNRDAVYRSFIRTEQTLNRRWNFLECGKHSYVLQSVDEPSQFRIAGSMCHDRFCLPCANTRSHVIAGNVIDHLKNRKARFLTLTLKSTDESLAHLIDKLTHDFARLRTFKKWKQRVDGGVAFIEIKWVPDRERWNVHLHMLVTGSYFPQKLLSHLWYRATGTSIIVDVRFAANNQATTRYIAKYASKPMNAVIFRCEEKLDESILALKGRRLCTTFGNWRDVQLTETLTDDGWNYVDTLQSLLTKAFDGDHTAIYICNKLSPPDAIAFPQPKPRPPPEPERMKPLTTQQEDLLFPMVYRPYD